MQENGREDLWVEAQQDLDLQELSLSGHLARGCGGEKLEPGPQTTKRAT